MGLRLFVETAALSALLPPNPRKSPHLASMTASHAALQRSRAVFPGRKANFAKVASCALLPLMHKQHHRNNQRGGEWPLSPF
jgi:hypothetical protein